MNAHVVFPLLIIAETQTSAESWVITMLNYGVAGCMLVWFMWRDNREGKTQDTRHKENLDAMKRIEDAFRTNTDSIIIGLSAMKNMDNNYSEMLAKFKEQNRTQPSL